MWKGIFVVFIAIVIAFLITAPLMRGGIKIVTEESGMVPIEKAILVPPNWTLIAIIWIIILIFGLIGAWAVES